MKILTLGIGLVALTCGASGVFAAPIFGTFNITGSVTVALTTIDWGSGGGTTGTFVTNNPGTDYFASIAGGNPPFYVGTVQDLFAPPVPVARFLDLFTAPGYTNLFFDLSSIIAPTAPACSTVTNPGLDVSCSFGAFTLKNSDGGATINLGVTGFFQDGLDISTRNAGIGLYTTQLVGNNVLNVVSTINGGGSIAAAYSANYAAALVDVPEPSTIYLLGGGGLLIGLGILRRKRDR